MRQEFELTDKSKKKARRIRQREEPKWRIFNLLTVIFSLGIVIFFLAGIPMGEENNYKMIDVFASGFAISIGGLAATRGILLNLTSHWLQDRLNERIWVEDGYLYHFVQSAIAAGLNFRNTDATATLYCMDISSIREVQYDPKSKRLEFEVDGTGIEYSDYRRGEIEEQWKLVGCPMIFYDCTKPSLLEFLKSQGIPYEEKTLDFKIRDVPV